MPNCIPIENACIPIEEGKPCATFALAILISPTTPIALPKNGSPPRAKAAGVFSF